MKTTAIKIRIERCMLFGVGVGILICCGVASGQSDSTVVEGKSFDNIRIGKSTENDVIAAYGAEYKLVEHRGYSRQLIYKDLGLSFYSCTADPRKEIFVVEITEPAQVVTDKAVRLGGSTMKEIFDKYGKPDRWSSGELFEYRGVIFYASPDDEDEDTNEAAQGENDVKEEGTAEPSEPADTDETAQSENDVKEEEATVEPSEPAEVKVEEIGDLPADSTQDQQKADENDSANPFDDDESVTTFGSTAKNDDKEKVEDEDTELKKSMLEAENKLVRRIELIERNGLRQCDTKFPKNR